MQDLHNEYKMLKKRRKIGKIRAYRIARYVIYKQTILEPIDNLWTFLGAFCGISLIGLIQSTKFELSDHIFLIGSFGASAVLIYGVTNSPLAQPRNLFGGHIIGALVGVSIAKIMPSQQFLWIASGLAVSISTVLIQITKTVHPPGGATALIAIIGSQKIKSLGFKYLFNPVLISVIIMFIIAIIFNNIPEDRSYPYRK